MIDPLQEDENLGKAYDLRIMRRLWLYVAPYKAQVAGPKMVPGGA